MVCKRGTGASLVSSDFTKEYFVAVLLPNAYVSKCRTCFTESELEQRIITHIQKFLMELGKGYAFVARQQHIRNWKRRLLHWSCFLQLHFEVLCIDWFKNVKNYTSGCGADGYVYLHLNIKPAFHQKNSFGKRLKFRRDFIIYRKKKTKKIKIFKIWVEKGVSHKNMACVFSCLERKWYRMAQISQYELVLHKDDNWKIVG